MLGSSTDQSIGIHAQAEKLQARQRFIGKLLTDPNRAGRPRPMNCHKYLLRGVATSADVVYVCQRSEPDLIELDDSPKALDQWWRLARTADREQQVEVRRRYRLHALLVILVADSCMQKVEVERVLRDMWLETKTPLMVYATEAAISTARAPLAGPLERFVKADNKGFRQELTRQQQVDNDESKPSAGLDVVSPTKRKHRSDSIDSMASNRASLGSIDMSDREDPFADQHDGAGQGQVAQNQPAYTPQKRGSADSMGRGGHYDVSGAQDETLGMPGKTTTTGAAAAPEEGDSSATGGTEIPTPSTSTQPGEHSQRMSPDAEGTRSPEMQERSRPPTFVARPSDDGEKPRTVNTMEMEIPGVQD